MSASARSPASRPIEKSDASVWPEFFARALGTTDVEIEPNVPFDSKSTLLSAAGLRVIWCSTSARICFDCPGATDPDTFAVIINLGGELTVSQHGSGVSLGHNEAVVLSHEPGSLTASESEFSCLIGSRAMLTRFGGEIGQPLQRRIQRENEALRHLIRNLHHLKDVSEFQAPEVQHLVATHIYDLVGMTLGFKSSSAHGVRAARLSALKADILENIFSRELTARSVACRQRFSPRYLHMLFETEGQTFSEFVLSHRLAHAHRLLSDPRFAHKTISSIAFESGFGDLSYFDRTFRRRFGETPSKVRHSWRAQNSQLAHERAVRPTTRAENGMLPGDGMLQENLQKRPVSIRRFQAEDAGATARIFYDAVHAGAAVHYDEAQRHAWAPQVPETSEWRDRLTSQLTLVAQRDQRLVGFMSLSSNGLVDLVFVAPEAARSGVAEQLHGAILCEARRLGLRRLCTQASRAARKFFESQGWSVVDEQAVSRDGVRLMNFVMERYLP